MLNDLVVSEPATNRDFCPFEDFVGTDSVESSAFKPISSTSGVLTIEESIRGAWPGVP